MSVNDCIVGQDIALWLMMSYFDEEQVAP
jgi:hypothetical protein